METELVMLTEGELTLTLGAGNYTMKPGDIAIILPGLIHNLYTENHSKSLVFKLYPVVDLSGIRLKSFIISEGGEAYGELKHLLLNIIEEDRTRADGYALAVNISAERILLNIVRRLEHEKKDARLKAKHTNENKLLATVNKFLEENFAEDFSLTDISRISGYEKSYFCRCFKKITGVTFWDYYTMFRLERAIELMKKPHRENVSQIATAAGFKNVRSFNEAFRSYFHCTPKQYEKTLN